jgi:hypothetical protein
MKKRQLEKLRARERAKQQAKLHQKPSFKGRAGHQGPQKKPSSIQLTRSEFDNLKQINLRARQALAAGEEEFSIQLPALSPGEKIPFQITMVKGMLFYQRGGNPTPDRWVTYRITTTPTTIPGIPELKILKKT